MAGIDLTAELFGGPSARDLSAELFGSDKPIGKMEKIGQGLVDPIAGGAQLLTKMLPDNIVKAGDALNNWIADKTGLVAKLPSGGVDQQVRDNEASYQKQRAASGESGFDGYRLLGNIASPANLALSAKLPQAATLAGRIGVGALGGGATAMMNPVTEGGDFWDEKAKQVGTGAAFGGATPLVTGAAARVISPKASVNPDLQLLRSEGVRPTIGQSMGGAANSIEEKLQSLPIMGDAIAAARGKAREQFNNAAINRATNEVGINVKGAGQDAVKEAGDKISKVYEAGKAMLGNFAIDGQAQAELQQLRKMAQQLPGRERMQFETAFSTLKNQLSPQGHLLAEGFKTLDSKLTNDAAKFSGSSDAYQKSLGDALQEMQRIIADNAKRANPKAAEVLNAADAAWANLVRVEGASVGAKGTGGVFTPGQLLTAVRGADKSVRDRATARGTALLQDLATSGQNVLGNKVPNSGTVDRLMLGGGALGSYFVNPAIPAGLLTGAALYSSPMQGLLNLAATKRPELAQPISDVLRKAAPALIPGFAQLGLQPME